LVVKNIEINKGVTLKRYRPRARGSAYRINKRTSNIVVTLAPKTDSKKSAPKAEVKEAKPEAKKVVKKVAKKKTVKKVAPKADK
jgi:large subunit ribosomal protein L22